MKSKTKTIPIQETNNPTYIREEDLCMYCLETACYQCKYHNACHNFCEEHVFYPAVLTDVCNNVVYYDGEHSERIWDN